jgi:hypothetical protein
LLGGAEPVTAGGHLKTITVANPINRCPTVVVSVEEVERFGQRYISLFGFAKQQGRHFLAVKKELEAAGIKPHAGAEDGRRDVLPERRRSG